VPVRSDRPSPGFGEKIEVWLLFFFVRFAFLLASKADESFTSAKSPVPHGLDSSASVEGTVYHQRDAPTAAGRYPEGGWWRTKDLDA